MVMPFPFFAADRACTPLYTRAGCADGDKEVHTNPRKSSPFANFVVSLYDLPSNTAWQSPTFETTIKTDTSLFCVLFRIQYHHAINLEISSSEGNQ